MEVAPGEVVGLIVERAVLEDRPKISRLLPATSDSRLNSPTPSAMKNNTRPKGIARSLISASLSARWTADGWLSRCKRCGRPLFRVMVVLLSHIGKRMRTTNFRRERLLHLQHKCPCIV